MRASLYVISLLLIICACTSKETAHIETVKNYYTGFNEGDYKLIKSQLSDSLTITEGDYVMRFTPESFKAHYKWDSVFKPKITIVDLKQEEDHILVTTSVTSARFEFLKNNPLVTKNRVRFANGKIRQIDNIAFLDTKWDLWTEQKTDLTQYIARNHKELDGFMIDQTLQGGLNYLKAIKLYTDSLDSITAD